MVDCSVAALPPPHRCPERAVMRQQARRREWDPVGAVGESSGITRLLDELLPDVSQSPERRFDSDTVSEAIIAALAELPAVQREVFIWHEVEGLSFREIAELTGEPVNTLLSRKRYAVLELRKRLQALKLLHP